MTIKRVGTLTPAQIDVLQFVYRGYQYAEIAAMRHCTKKTIMHQVGSLLADAGVRNSRELIYEALSRGWLKAPQRYVE